MFALFFAVAILVLCIFVGIGITVLWAEWSYNRKDRKDKWPPSGPGLA